MSWKRAGNHLQGVFVQTIKWWSLRQACPIAIYGILSNRSASQHLLGWNGLVLSDPQEEAELVGLVPLVPKVRRARGNGGREKLYFLYHWSLGGETTSYSTTYLVISQYDPNPKLLTKRNQKHPFKEVPQLENKSLSKWTGHMLSKIELLKMNTHTHTHIQVQHTTFLE